MILLDCHIGLLGRIALSEQWPCRQSLYPLSSTISTHPSCDAITPRLCALLALTFRLATAHGEDPRTSRYRRSMKQDSSSVRTSCLLLMRVSRAKKAFVPVRIHCPAQFQETFRDRLPTALRTESPYFRDSCLQYYRLEEYRYYSIDGKAEFV